MANLWRCLIKMNERIKEKSDRKNLALALLALILSVPASAHLELDLLTPDGELYPGCEVEPDSRPADCPHRVQIQGFDVYVSALIWDDENAVGPGGNRWESSEEAIISYLEMLDLQLNLISQNSPFPMYFSRHMQEVGLTFYIAPMVNRPELGYGENWIDWSPNDRFLAGCLFGDVTAGCYGNGRVQLNMNRSFERTLRVLIHEMAHAWHDLILPDGFNNKCVLDIYEMSVNRDRIYQNFVYKYPGYKEEGREPQVGAYADTNAQEYFAELVLAYYMPSGHQVLPFDGRTQMYEVDFNGFYMVRYLFDSIGKGKYLYRRPYAEDCVAFPTKIWQDFDVFWPQ